MPSIIEGYNYDIFISYRQKDNKHDGWVTEFVSQLKGELEATFKEDISIYFDENPSDGLLETHSVDKSLEGKLKCLIFIPIISQTYCDSKSFAWQHEFCAFNKLSKEDQFGRDIKLSSGNVASRILPVKIHILDPDDKTLLEDELGGALRSVEFIYKEPGVNRPLRSYEDHPDNNLNKTFYRNQINKVANAVKEIITALKKQSQHPEEVTKQEFELKPAYQKNLRTKIIAGSLILLTFLVLGYSIVPKLFKPKGQLEKSIAVLPFRNDSPNDSNTYFINGIMDEVITDLKTIANLRVISRTSVEQFRNKVKSVPQIAKELGVNYIVEGRGEKYGSTFSLRVKMIRATNENQLWTESYGQEIKDVNDICNIQRQIALEIAKELKVVITPQEEKMIQLNPTNDLLAYQYYLQGVQYVSESRLDLAISMACKAIERDSGFVMAYLYRSLLYSTIFFTKGEHYTGNWENFDQLAGSDIEKARKINPDLPEIKLTTAEQLYVSKHHDAALKLLDEIEKQMSNNSLFFIIKSNILRRKGEWKESIEAINRALLLDPLNALYYNETGHTYLLLRRYPEALDYFNKPKSLGIINSLTKEDMADIFLAVLLWKGDPEEALKASELSAEDIGYDYYYFSRQFDKLIPITGKSESQFEYYPKTLKLAKDYYFKSDISLCRQYADSAIAELKSKIREAPNDDRYYAAIGYAYAYKGDNKNALENAKKAAELKPLTLDAWQGYEKQKDLAAIYVLTGNYDLAMDKAEYLLTIPGDLSVPLLRIDPICDPMRSLPRFQKILATEYKTNY
jgi:TolB-like protein/Flp pilus assembly protein TadD